MRLSRMFFVAARSYKRVLPLMRDARVPLVWKSAAVVLALLIVSPLDLFGDIPILGLFDDAALLTLLSMLFVWLGTQAIEKNVTPQQVIGGPPAVR